MGNKEQYERLRNELLKDTSVAKPNRDLFKKFFEWEEEKLKRMNNLSELDDANFKTLKDYPNKFRNVNLWFNNKQWAKLSSKEIRKVYNDLSDGLIKNRNGKKFGDIRSYVNKIFKAKPFELAGLKEKVKEALEFYVDRREQKEVRFVNEKNFRLLVEHSYNTRDKALFWLEWDIGENINSLLKLRKKNFTRQINSDLNEPEYLVFLPEHILKRTRRPRREPTLYPETVKWLDKILKDLDDEDLVFPFVYRQALKIFDAAVKRSGIRCEPNGEKPSWKDLRSGMACHLFESGWHLEDINMRLGHSPTSHWLESYINYLATNRKIAKKNHFNNSLGKLSEELAQSKQREKHRLKKMSELEENYSILEDSLEDFRKIFEEQEKKWKKEVLQKGKFAKGNILVEKY